MNIERTEVGQIGRIDQSITGQHPKVVPLQGAYPFRSISIDQWLDYGASMGWCGVPVCAWHDGIPTTLLEDEEFDKGTDSCAHIIRIYKDEETRIAVEENHAPSVWRKSNK